MAASLARERGLAEGLQMGLQGPPAFASKEGILVLANSVRFKCITGDDEIDRQS
jgi:hypothetical protein